MATYAVGDVQGCYQPLRALLDRVNFKAGRDRLWLVGDLVNRGPESLAVLRFVKALGDSARLVLGNHDLHFLAVAEGIRAPGRSDTLDELLAAPDCAELVRWLRGQPLFYRDRRLGFSMVHAGIPPMWGLKKTARRAAEVEAALQGPLYRDFLRAMYGNEPRGWQPGMDELTRLRVITNYLTRMRFCSPTGELDIENKAGPMQVRFGFAPWFALDNRKSRRHRILFGHWAALEGHAAQTNVWALDTGCVWGGQLTALRLEDQQLFQVPASSRWP